MNSAERARESQRYESALLDGTYNNPMLQKSTVDSSLAYRGLGQAQRDEEAAKSAKIAAEQRRRYEEQMERERQAAAEAYYRARQQEALENHLEFERNFARNGLKRWGFQDIASLDVYAQKAEQVLNGKMEGIATIDIYPTALAMRRMPVKAANPRAGTIENRLAQLALKALAEGEILPAILLADDILQDREFLGLLAYEGTEFDRISSVYHTGGYGWPAYDEVRLARIHQMVTEAQLAELERARQRSSEVLSPYRLMDPRYMVLRLVHHSHLAPWHGGSKLLNFFAQAELANLREARPVLGYFATALYEERLRYDPSRPSPWADFMFERAAQLAGPGMISEVARMRRENLQSKEAAVFNRWRELQAAGQLSNAASLDGHTLWRVAGRLILGHDLASLSAELADRNNQASVANRLALAHDMLWELTTRGERHAITIQYLAAIQDVEAARPSLLAYLNAYHWLLGWDLPPPTIGETAMIAASFLEAMPASQSGRHYPDSATSKALKAEPPDSLKSFPYAMLGDHSWHSTGYLEALPLRASIMPAVILHRNRTKEEASMLDELTRTIRPSGFAARLARQHQLTFAKALKDSYLENWARECLAKLDAEKSGPEIKNRPEALHGALMPFGETALKKFGTSLLCEPLPLGSAVDSEQVLEAVAIRNLAVKPFLPYTPLLPFPISSRGDLFAHDSGLRRMVAAHALNNLDDSYATSVNLPAELALKWLKEGAQAGEELCALRLAQLTLHEGPLAMQTALTAAAAETQLDQAVEKGMPGAVEFYFAYRRKQAKTVDPDKLVASVHAAWQRGSPLAAQAWLDSLEANRPWTPEQAAREVTALRIAGTDFRDGASERWRKALEKWSAQMREHRDLLVGRPEAEAIAQEFARIVQQCDSIALVYPKDMITQKGNEIFPLLADANATLPPSPSETLLRQTMTGTFHVKRVLRDYGRFVPLDAALSRARAEKERAQREYAAMDAARWFVINQSSYHKDPGPSLLGLLPEEPDQHPLWEQAAGTSFVAKAFTGLPYWQMEPEKLTAALKMLTGVVSRQGGKLDAEELAVLVEGFDAFSRGVQNKKEVGTLPEIEPLMIAFDLIGRTRPAVAQNIYTANSRFGRNNYAQMLFDRVLQPDGAWISLSGECYGRLAVDNHIENLKRILGFDAARIGNGADDVRAWVSDAASKAARADAPQKKAELALTVHKLAAKWAAFTPTDPDHWAKHAFLLGNQADYLAPSPEASRALLLVLQPRKASIMDTLDGRAALQSWKERAVENKSLETLRMLEPFAPDMISEAIDELEGFPRREAAQAEYQRKLALIEPCLEMIKAGQNVSLAVRTIERLSEDGLHIFEWTQLTCVKAAALDGQGKVALPGDPRLLGAVIRFLSAGSAGWQSDDETKQQALELSPVAKRLWETRTSWNIGYEHELVWTTYHYASMGEAWAIDAWKSLAQNPSPKLRVLFTRSGLGQELGVPNLTESEAKEPVYAEAARALDRADQRNDDPVAEFEAYRKNTPPPR